MISNRCVDYNVTWLCYINYTTINLTTNVSYLKSYRKRHFCLRIFLMKYWMQITRCLDNNVRAGTVRCILDKWSVPCKQTIKYISCWNKKNLSIKTKKFKTKIDFVIDYRVTTVKRNGRNTSFLLPVHLFNFSLNKSVFHIAFIPSDVNGSLIV